VPAARRVVVLAVPPRGPAMIPAYFVAASVAVAELLEDKYDGTFSERDNDVARTAADIAARVAVAAERDRIRQLAITTADKYDADAAKLGVNLSSGDLRDFADLIGGDQP
jgi:cell pole-organizing protein PopZ